MINSHYKHVIIYVTILVIITKMINDHYVILGLRRIYGISFFQKQKKFLLCQKIRVKFARTAIHKISHHKRTKPVVRPNHRTLLM